MVSGIEMQDTPILPDMRQIETIKHWRFAGLPHCLQKMDSLPWPLSNIDGFVGEFCRTNLWHAVIDRSTTGNARWSPIKEAIYWNLPSFSMQTEETRLSCPFPAYIKPTNDIFCRLRRLRNLRAPLASGGLVVREGGDCRAQGRYWGPSINSSSNHRKAGMNWMHIIRKHLL